MRYYLIAGEASGDLHASNLMRSLKSLDPDAVFRCWGGDLMEQEGAVLVKHYRDLAFMGFAEVVSHLPTILKNFKFCEKDLLKFNADVLILVDYPGFNLRMSGFAKKHGIPVFYYISPQLWAWRPSRVKAIRQHVDRMFVILPFEQEFYKGYDYPVDFCGHPLLDVIHEQVDQPHLQAFRTANDLPDLPMIALLPGSRKMEIEKMLQIMTSVQPDFPQYQFVIAGAPSMPASFYRGLFSNSRISVVSNQTYQLLGHATAALVTSGTATLETALIGVPQVVCYRGNTLSYLIAKRLVHVKYISLVNLICNRLVVPELIQNDLTRDNLRNTLDALLHNEATRSAMFSAYADLRQMLGGRGASTRVATLMVQYLKQK